MARTHYRAFQAIGGGKLELVERMIEEPQSGMVRVAVEACGVCHTDTMTVEGEFPGLTYPRVPGHEAVGRIDAIGPGVEDRTIGQRVGVGFPTGRCGICPRCRRGDFVNCVNQRITGFDVDGGYAEMMMANQHALVSIPDELGSVDAAPLQCAGVTTFNALRKSIARAGDLVAILGIGGLGHLAVQFARHMGFRTVAIDVGADRKDAAIALGAQLYIDSSATDPAAALTEMGGANVIVATASKPSIFGGLVKGLIPRGQMILVGAGPEPVTLDVADMLFGERKIAGTANGSPIEVEDTLNFSVLEDIRAKIEPMPFERAPEAYAKMLAGLARFRIVLDMTATG